MKFNGRLVLFTLVLIVMAIACKLLFGPHLTWSGFSPILAIALFSGMIIPEKSLSFVLPFLALLISDVVIEVLNANGLFEYPGFYNGQWKQYTILLGCTLIGWALKGRKISSIVIGAIAAPTLFFLVSNFGVWLNGEVVYSRDFNGIIECYTAALPFYRNALIATVIFLPTIIFMYNYITRKRNQLVLS